MRSPIICGIDGSRASLTAARLARGLAARLALRLDLIHVVGGVEEAHDVRAIRALRARANDEIGPDAVLRVEAGSPGERLVAASRRAALLVIGTRGDGALRQALLGSVSMEVTRSAAAPVVVIPPAAVDVARGSPGGRGLLCAIRDDHDMACAGTAACWARELGMPLTLVHVVPPVRLPIAPGGCAPPVGLVHGADEAAAEALAMLDEIACAISPTAPAVCRTLLGAGPVGPQLEHLARAEDAALVAVGPCRHGALAGALAGSPSRHLMRRGSRPVMVCPSPEAVLA
jgi:nucleotide-binding universal stress UspA family protein